MNWIKIEDQKPSFKEWVLCKIMPPEYPKTMVIPQDLPQYAVLRRMDMGGSFDRYKLPYGGILDRQIKVVEWKQLED